tara:strand:+ start:2136 stop:2468 length:333 start_codon:yes stop_codon:yes gene_type:complete
MGKIHKANRIGTYSKVVQIAQYNKDKEESLRKVAEVVNGKYPQFDYCIEVYNSNSLSKMPNTIGLSIFYPSSDATTHQLCKEYPGGITDVQVNQFLTEMCETLLNKIPGE